MVLFTEDDLEILDDLLDLLDPNDDFQNLTDASSRASVVSSWGSHPPTGASFVNQPLVNGYQPPVNGYQPPVNGYQPPVNGDKPLINYSSSSSYSSYNPITPGNISGNSLDYRHHDQQYEQQNSQRDNSTLKRPHIVVTLESPRPAKAVKYNHIPTIDTGTHFEVAKMAKEKKSKVAKMAKEKKSKVAKMAKEKKSKVAKMAKEKKSKVAEMVKEEESSDVAGDDVKSWRCDTVSVKSHRGVATVTREMLQQLFHMPISAAAEELKLSLSCLKSICRAFGIARWPARQLKSLVGIRDTLDTMDYLDGHAKVQMISAVNENYQRIMMDPAAGLDASCTSIRNAQYKKAHKERNKDATA